MDATPLGSASLIDPTVSEFHPASVVVDHLLPVVGFLFAIYLLALFALFLITVAFKVTGHQGAHHPASPRREVVLPEVVLPEVALPEPVLVGGVS